MAENDLDLELLDQDIEKQTKVEKRIRDLSEKVELTSKERDELKGLSAEKDTKIAGLEKERDFLNSFGDSVAKYPQASSYRDAIKEKVLSGYSVEDATVTVLVKEGKMSFDPPKPKEQPKESPAGFAGGSAINQPAMGEKPVSQMSQAERRAALVEAEARGDLGMS